MIKSVLLGYIHAMQLQLSMDAPWHISSNWYKVIMQFRWQLRKNTSMSNLFRGCLYGSRTGPRYRASPLNEISPSNTIPNQKFCAFIWTRRDGPLRSSEILLAGMKISPYINTHKRASHKNTRYRMRTSPRIMSPLFLKIALSNPPF